MFPGSASPPSSSEQRGVPTSLFTCNTCLVTFDSNEFQRTHMQSEWHIYNLKRRIVSLPSISSKVFENQVLAAKSSVPEANASFQQSCTACQKVYHSVKAYQSHLKSQNHALNMINLEASELPAVGDDIKSTELNALSSKESIVSGAVNANDTGEGSLDTAIESYDPLRCLFCNVHSASLELNLAHMFKMHGMFIPNQEYLNDTESLLGYLFRIISEFHTCLSCGITKSTVEGIQQHMKDKGHCMINFDDDTELELFYDFSISESNTEDEGGANPTHENDENDDERPTDPITSSEYELHLPSGKTLGHRSHARYYRQNLHNYPTPAERAEQRAIEEASSIDSPEPGPEKGRRVATRANGGSGMIGVPETQKRALRAVEKKMLKLDIRARNQFQWAVEKSSNSQKHFHNDVPGPKLG